jgi:hypothetical protein
VEQPATSELSNLDVANQGVDATITEGDNESVAVNVTNVGDQSGSFDVTLEIGTSVTQTQTTSTVGGGATETVTFETVTGGLTDGTYDVNVTTANATVTGSLTVEQPATSALSGLDIAGQGANATLTAGANESVAVNITNTGDQAGSFDVTLEIGTAVTETRATGTLGAGATETVDFQNVTGGLADGTYAVNTTTADDATTGNLTVEQPATSSLSNLDIAGQGADATITQGDTESVAVDVTNVGDQSGSFDVTLAVGAAVTETEATDTLGAGATGTVVFPGVTSGLSTGTYNVTVTTANGTLTGTLTVGQAGLVFYAGGNGTASNPYRIADWTHLNNTRLNPDANFTLVADLNETTRGYGDVAGQTANGGAGFVPVGGLQTPDRFTGTFDGSDYTIDGLSIDRPNEDRVGLFGYVWNGGTVESLTLTNVTVTGDDRVGAIAGFLEGGVVARSSVAGDVTGNSAVGGLAGAAFNIEGSPAREAVRSVVTESSATGAVTGQNGRVGGLLGSSRATVENSYATARVTAGSDAPTGGLVGTSGTEGTIRDSYAAGLVTGAVTGGVAGQTSGTVEDVYWDVNVTGQASATALGSVGNATGLTTAEMTGDDARQRMDLSFGTAWRVVAGDYPALLSRTGPPALVPGGPPRDPDDDGLYEDLNGNGAVTVLDVQVLFDSLGTDLLQRNAASFDFQDDDPAEIGFLDVQVLFDEDVTS